MKEILVSEGTELRGKYDFPFKSIDYVFAGLELLSGKTKDNVKVTIYIPDYKKNLDAQYLESLAKVLAEADAKGEVIEDYVGTDVCGEEMPVNLADEDLEDCYYSIDYRGIRRTTFKDKLEELKASLVGKLEKRDREELERFMEDLPWEFLSDTRTVVQVLNKIKRTYHPKNKYDDTSMLKNIENELLYYFASCRFDLTGNYDLYSSNWYVIRDMFSLGKFSKHSTQSMLFVESSDLKAILRHVGHGTCRFSVFEDKRYFNRLSMEYLTVFKGNFSITTGGHDIEEESTKLIELDGTYRIYTYDSNLFAFVRE
jgi:hypothetical protein